MLSGHIPVFLALIVLPVSSYRVSEYVKVSSGTLFEFALLVLALALKHDVANFSASSRVRFLSRCSVWPQVRRSFRFSQERACGPHTPWVLHTVVAVYVWLVAETSVIPGFFPICHEALEWIAELRTSAVRSTLYLCLLTSSIASVTVFSSSTSPLLSEQCNSEHISFSIPGRACHNRSGVCLHSIRTFA